MAGIGASLADLEALENELFDEYNGEGHMRFSDLEAYCYSDLDYMIMCDDRKEK